MALHGYVNTMRCTCVDVDAYNCAGVYATSDLDNGVLVTLTKMNQDAATLKAKGFEFEVTPATQNSTSVWIVATPEVGSTIMQQELSDPREFYNEAGRPMSLKYMNPKVDCIEVTAECFTDNTLPGTGKTYVQIGANGKMTAVAAAPGTGAYFSLVALNTIAIGMQQVPTAIIRCERN